MHSILLQFMKKLFFLAFGLSFMLCFAQRHELGIFVGGANVVGDIGKDNFINPLPVKIGDEGIFKNMPIAIGGIYRFNFNPHMGFRLMGTYARVVGSDLVANESYKKDRGYSYRNNIIEGALLFEYNFFEINNEYAYGDSHSPYIFGGFGGFMYDNLVYTVNHGFQKDENGVAIPNTLVSTIESRPAKETKFTFPFGAGYKYKFRSGLVLSAEVGFRFTKTDNLDFSFADPSDFIFNAEPGLDPISIEEINSNIIKSRQVGNTSSYDWYVFTGFTLTYSFGRPPCYCD